MLEKQLENQSVTPFQNLASQEIATTGMSFDTTKALGSLKKFQEPLRFQKAQFNLKLYKRGGNTQ
jgi:hypothetical protein